MGACQTTFKELGLPVITDEEVECATYAYSNEEMPKRNMAQDLESAQFFLDRGYTSLDLAKALKKNGFPDVAENVLSMLKERVSGDYLQVSSIFDHTGKIFSGLNDGNDYRGPGTGFRLEGEKWNDLKQKTSAINPEDILEIQKQVVTSGRLYRMEKGGAAEVDEADIVIGVSPAFSDREVGEEICQLHYQILQNLVKGIQEHGLTVQIIKVYHTAELSEIARRSAENSKLKVGIGIQSRGRVYINDQRENAREKMKGFFHITLSSPALYQIIGNTAAALVKGMPLPASDTMRQSGLTKYQLEMIKLTADEKQFVRNKNPERLWLVE